MAKKKKPDTEPAEGGASMPMAFRPSAELREAIEALAIRERRKAAQMVVLLLEDALKAKGLWPPQGTTEKNEE